MGLVGNRADFVTAWAARHQKSAKAGKRIPWITVVIFYTLCANLPYWIVSHEFGFSPLGCFCVQYATVGLLALFLPRFVSAFLLLAVIFIDLLCGICFSYSLPIQEIIENIGVAHAFSGARLWLAATVAFLSVLVALLSFFLPTKELCYRQRWTAAICLAAFACATVGFDVISIRIATGVLPARFLPAHTPDAINARFAAVPRLARIPIVRLARMQLSQDAYLAHERRGSASSFPVPSATGVALRGSAIQPPAGNHDLPNIVLVLVESWGLATDAPLRDALVQPYRQPDLQARYDVRQGTVPFYGPTIAGEARELCGSGIGFYLLAAPASDLQSCLPERLGAMGYNTIALHGMNARMFNRGAWYGTIGFRERWFHDQFMQAGLPDCTDAFVGTCDADIAAWIGRRLEEDNSRPAFIHWMTLGSHLPVPIPAHLANAPSCVSTLALAEDSPLCSWYQLVVNVHQSVAQVAMQNLFRPTVFVIVGDHAPPFSNSALHNRFSRSDVPYVLLVPRSLAHWPKMALAQNADGSFTRSDTAKRQTP